MLALFSSPPLPAAGYTPIQRWSIIPAVTHIGINAHLLAGEQSYRRAGIHHYISQLLAHLPADTDLEYTVFTQPHALVTRPDVDLVRSRWPTERRFVRILWEQCVWPLAGQRRQLDLLHSMAFVLPFYRPVPGVVTVYDLSFMHYPERFPALQRWYLTTQTRRSCRAARRVTTISASGAEDVHRYFGVPRERIDVVQPGLTAGYGPRSEAEVAAFRTRKGLPERFILHVGTLQPRKNIPVLIEALAQLPIENVPLVLVGGKGWLYEAIFARVEALGLQDRVLFTGYVPDDELPLWYSAASLFVFPSLYEGFGLPVLEAMACGTPVVAADTSSLPEVAGDAALLFPPHDIPTLVEHMRSVLGNSDLAATMRRRGLTQAQRFSWVRAGEEMAGVYRKAVERR